MPRLGHKKSRLGCRQCKARHVKCDELKPCTHCARHGVQCSLITDPPSSTPSTGTGSSGGASKHERESRPSNKRSITDSSASSPLLTDHIPNPSAESPEERASEGSSPNTQTDQFPFLRPFVHKSATSQSDLWVRDIELMHHWTIEAYDELSQREDMRFTWRVEAPKVAVTHTFLLHEILAFSAFHKASLLPEKRRDYYTLGIHHQDLAIKGIRPKLQKVVPDEAPAIIATSTLLTLGVFASIGFESISPDVSLQPSAIDGILDIFLLMQGMGNILALAQIHVYESFLAPMFRDPLESTPSQPLLQELIHRLPSLVSFIETKQGLSDEERTSLLGVVSYFEPALRIAISTRVDNRELRFLFFWPLHLDASFLVSIRKRHSGALIILMYYATMLFAAEPRYWFMDGWGHRLMKACCDEVDESWLPASQWPMSFLETGSTYSASNQIPGNMRLSRGSLVESVTHQPQRTVPSRKYMEPSLRLSNQSTMSTLDHSGPYPHLTGKMPPSYKPQTTSATYLPPTNDAVHSQRQHIDHVNHVSSESSELGREPGQGADQKS